MSASLKRFDIILDNSSATFSPGSTITGRLILDLYKIKSFRALKLRFKGKCTVSWKEGSGKNTRHYRGSEEYFRSDVILHGSTSGESIDLPAGNHAFPFNFSLPHNIPSSFEHQVGSVEYTIKAIIDRPWKFDHKTKKIFTVETPLELDLASQSMHEIDDEIRENYCCFLVPCIDQGSMQFRIQIPRTGYSCGDPIEATVHIDNKSPYVNVTKVKLCLEQKLKFHSHSPQKTKSVKTIVQKAKRMGPFPNSTSVIVGFQVPTVPLSHLQYCSLIDITYRARIIVSVSGCHCATDKKYDVLIGSRPPISLPQGINPFAPGYNVPSAPIDYPTSPSTYHSSAIPYPMPVSMSSSSTITSPTMPYPHQPLPGNYPPYPPAVPGLQPENQFIGAYAPPPNIGFVYPSAPATLPHEQLPPSYESVMAENTRK